MANKILTTFETIVKPTISLASIANGAGRICGVIDNTTARAREGFVHVQVKSGASAPTAGAPYKVYLVRRSNDGTNDISDDGLGTTDAAVSTEPAQAECLGSIVVTATSNATFRKSFLMRDLSSKFSIVIWNASGQTISTTGGDHDVQVQLINPEVQ